MPTNKILFSTDFSRLSDAALPLATSLARDHGTELIFVHVQEPPTAYAAGELSGPLRNPTPNRPCSKCSTRFSPPTPKSPSVAEWKWAIRPEKLPAWPMMRVST